MPVRRVPVLLAVLLAVGPAARVSGAQTAADLFGSLTLERLDLYMHSLDWAKLKENFRLNERYPVDVTWRGQTVRNAGVRSRGTGTRSGTKPSLKIDFNHYAEDQHFLGLKSLVLDNLLQDPSGVHEPVSMWFFARLGIPAPREVHVVLYVNNEYVGVYAAVEPVDKVMLARVFGSIGDDVQNDGHLYEYNKVTEWRLTYLGSDLNAYKPYFSPKTHEEESDEQLFRPIETMVRLINETPAGDLPAVLGPYLDLGQLVRYVAVQNFLAENDGFLGQWGMNNFYLYRLEASSQHVFIPWDDDLTFWGDDPTYGVQSFHDTNVLWVKLMQLADYRALYLATLDEAANVAGEGASDATAGRLEIEIRRQLDLIDQAMRADPKKPFTETDFQTASDLMKHWAPTRVAFVKCEVARLSGAGACRY
jgi:spore coat protein CotH